MSIFLVGGAAARTDIPVLVPRFLREAGESEIAVLVAHHSGVNAEGSAISAALAAAGARGRLIELGPEGLDLSDLAGTRGLIIADGQAALLRERLEPLFGELRRRAAAGEPVLAFGAGARITAERALLGGHRIGGVTVCPDNAADGLDEVTIAPGIGLIDIPLDTGTAQHGTLGRVIAAAEAGEIDGALAIDENTALVVGDGGLTVLGSGSVWQILGDEQGLRVSTIAAN